MDNLRAELERLYAEDDRLRREFECHEAKRQREVHARGEQPELVRRDGNFEMRHGRPVPQQQLRSEQPEQRIRTLDEETMSRWNAWMDHRIRTIYTRYFGKLTSEMVDDERRLMHEHVAREVGKLREEIGGLRADQAVDRGIHRQEIIDLPQFVKRKRDAA